ncbi:MAG: thioredoxin family protein [Mycobacteriales bacterium]
MSVRELRDTAQTQGAHVLGFVAQSCGPCLQQRPIWDALAEEVLLVDVDAFPDLRARYGVEALPTTVVLGPAEPLVLRGVQTTRQLHEALGSPVG